MKKIIISVPKFLAIGWVIAVASSILDTLHHILIRSYLVDGANSVWIFSAQSIVINFGFALVFALFFLLLFIAVRLFLGKPIKYGASLIAFCFGPTAAFLSLALTAIPVNENLLPIFFTPLSLAANGLMLVVAICFAILSMFLGKRLIRKLRKKWIIIPGYIFAIAGIILTITGFSLSKSQSKLPLGEPIASPNVIIITIDAYRQDRLSAYSDYKNGETITPNLDAFAERSTRFETACSHSPWTVPSMYTMHSSRYPGVHNAHLLRKGNPEIVMLADVLKSRGYDTEAYIANYVLYEELGFGQGFDRYVEFGDIEMLRMFNKTSLYRFVKKVKERGGAYFEFDGTSSTTWTSGKTVASLSRKRKKPLFLWAHYLDPHTPLIPPRRYVEGNDDFVNDALVFGRLRTSDKFDFNVEDADKFIALYDAEVRYVDDQLGRVFTAIEEYGFLDNSIIVITADHGEEHFEHGRYGHGTSHRDKVISVPMLIYVPEKYKGVCNRPAGLIDVAPTITDYIGIDDHPFYSGESLIPYISAGEDSNPGKFIFLDETNDDPDVKSVRRDKYMLTRYGDDDAVYEMVDLDKKKGPGYIVENLDPGLYDEYRSALDNWIEGISKEADELGGANDILDIDEDRKSKLEGLGYL